MPVSICLKRSSISYPIALYTRGRIVDAEQIAELRRNLNRPVGEQFLDYVKNPFSSGIDSVQFSRPVWEVIGDRVWPTLVLLGTSNVLAALIGVWLGIRSAWRRAARGWLRESGSREECRRRC